MAKRKRKSRDKVQKVMLHYGNFDPDIPVNDFFKYIDLHEQADVEEALENLIHDLESDYFLMWEAVVCEEQGIISKEEKKLLDGLLNFGDDDEDQILYINEIPRPKEAWYDIARKIVPCLLVEPFRTDAIMYSVIHEGWANLVDILEEHAQDLSLPEGAKSFLDIFPRDLQHRLWLQTCFDALSGLGQEKDLTLEDEEEYYRIEEFICLLRAHKDTVEYFNLTLEGLLKRVIMPQKDENIFITMMMDQLDFPSSQEYIAQFL